MWNQIKNFDIITEIITKMTFIMNVISNYKYKKFNIQYFQYSINYQEFFIKLFWFFSFFIISLITFILLFHQICED